MAATGWWRQSRGHPARGTRGVFPARVLPQSYWGESPCSRGGMRIAHGHPQNAICRAVTRPCAIAPVLESNIQITRAAALLRPAEARSGARVCDPCDPRKRPTFRNAKLFLRTSPSSNLRWRGVQHLEPLFDDVQILGSGANQPEFLLAVTMGDLLAWH